MIVPGSKPGKKPESEELVPVNEIAEDLGISYDIAKRNLRSAKEKYFRRMLALMLLERIEISLGRPIREDEEDAIAEHLAFLYLSDDPCTIIDKVVVSFKNGN